MANYSATNPRNGFQYTGRIDHSFNDKDKIFLTFNNTDLHQVAFASLSYIPRSTQSSLLIASTSPLTGFTLLHLGDGSTKLAFPRSGSTEIYP